MSDTQQSLGAQLAHLQIDLATLWNEQGPDAVMEYLKLADQQVVRALLMVNIGRQASLTLR